MRAAEAVVGIERDEPELAVCVRLALVIEGGKEAEVDEALLAFCDVVGHP
jgi:hypothetical protein